MTRSVVQRVNAERMDALAAWAEGEFRAMNGQLQWSVADALRRSGRLKKPRPQAARAAAPDGRPASPAASKNPKNEPES